MTSREELRQVIQKQFCFIYFRKKGGQLSIFLVWDINGEEFGKQL